MDISFLLVPLRILDTADSDFEKDEDLNLSKTLKKETREALKG
jgi:hypothetical protein